ncbi:hypothetical protein BB560_001093 [Smittium megazygosporum]|uniref:U2 snRNP-associated SURP motif-containing protein n=1 Tax=Smittium megazygosporum TaxID=133381 RepID=A0A2T9ZIJ7_9FUNG|nr:hypothetical protein BB560_001093 [Smittium megazygosporum]
MQKRKTLNLFGQHAKKSLALKKKAEEDKKQKEAEEEAKVYEEFVAAFDDRNDSGIQFVKSNSTKDATSNTKTQYNPPLPFSPKTSHSSQTSNSITFDKEAEDFSLKSRSSNKKRNLDAFLQVIKKEQEAREERIKSKKPNAKSANSSNITLLAAFESNPGSHEVGDETTTNVYVGNLNPAVNEEMLLKLFGKYGPIGSVKIMWPRKQDELSRSRNSGFVCFMDRESASNAIDGLDSHNLLGNELRLCWGKSMPIPPIPIYVPGDKSYQKESLSGLPFNAKPPPKARGGFSNFVSSVPSPDDDSEIPEVHVKMSMDSKSLCLIHHVCEYVIRYGPKFEEMLMIKEHDSPKFRFLFENESSEHVYYRWKLYSLLNGDSTDHWSTKMFYMFSKGPIWYPPEIPQDKTAKEEEKNSTKTKELKSTLGKVALNRLYKRLKGLDLTRGSIANAMVFAIEHAEVSDQVAKIICEYHINESQPQTLLLSRLFLISDILHNCSASAFNAWKFRQAFERYLVEFFQVLKRVYNSISARLKADQFKKNVLSILAVWEVWLIFPIEYLKKLASGFI